MRYPQVIASRIASAEEMEAQLLRWRLLEKKVSFTNGCFDVLHSGHIASLSQAASEADYLIVGVNTDRSARALKGEGRPVNDQQARCTLLASLIMVDLVVLFDEDTPLDLIRRARPEVLVKGGDYTLEQIVGAADVKSWGGRVVINALVPGKSTTAILEKISRL